MLIFQGQCSYSEFSISSSSTWCVAFLPPRSWFQFITDFRSHCISVYNKQVHGWKTEYYLGAGDFVVAPRSFEFRGLFPPQRDIVHVRSSTDKTIFSMKFTSRSSESFRQRLWYQESVAWFLRCREYSMCVYSHTPILKHTQVCFFVFQATTEQPCHVYLLDSLYTTILYSIVHCSWCNLSPQCIAYSARIAIDWRIHHLSSSIVHCPRFNIYPSVPHTQNELLVATVISTSMLCIFWLIFCDKITLRTPIFPYCLYNHRTYPNFCSTFSVLILSLTVTVKIVIYWIGILIQDCSTPCISILDALLSIDVVIILALV